MKIRFSLLTTGSLFREAYSLAAGFMAFVKTVKDGVVQNLTGLADLLVGIFTMNPEKVKKGLQEIGGSIKTIYYDAGKKAGAAFSQGYDEKLAAEQEKSGNNFSQLFDRMEKKLLKQAEEASKKRIAAEAAARLQALKDEEANLKVKLAQVEEGSRAELKLKQQLIGVQAKIELEDAKKTENDKRVIRAEAQDKIADLEAAFNKKQAKEREDERKKLAKAAEDAAKKELELLHAMQDLRVVAIKDDHLRELAELDLQLARKVEKLTGTEEQMTEMKLLLVEARNAKVADLQAKWDEEEKKKQDEQHQKDADLSTAADEEYTAYLENKVANGLLTEQAYQDALYEIKKQALESQLALLVQQGKGETAEAKRLHAALLKADAEHVTGQKKNEEDLSKFKKAMATSARTLLTDSLGFLLDNLDKQSTAYLFFKNALKTLQIAEIGINLEGELAANAKAASQNPANGVTYGAAGAGQLAVTNALSIGRAILSGIKVAAFANGGRTDKGAALPVELIASLLSGASGGSFAAGGKVPGPTLGLIGEAGAELVIPNWLFTDPKQANIMGYLEAQIASRGNAFADGGRTVERGAGVVTGPAGDADGEMLELMRQLVRGQVEFRDEISTWQREFDVRLDLVKAKKAIDVVTQTQTGGGIR